MKTPSPLVTTFAANIRALRKRHRMTAQALSDRCSDQGHHIHRSVIAKIEKGHRAHVTIDDLNAIAHVFSVSPERLLAALCPRCQATPSEGFTCNECGLSS